jgi:hypothetical protein
MESVCDNYIQRKTNGNDKSAARAPPSKQTQKHHIPAPHSVDILGILPWTGVTKNTGLKYTQQEEK